MTIVLYRNPLFAHSKFDMDYEIALLYTGSMSKIYIAENANKILIEYLEGLGHIICPVRRTSFVGMGVAAHPDIYMCKLGAIPAAPVFHGDVNALGPVYPQDVKYNGAVMGRYLICNARFTSPALMQKASDLGITALHVPQGYAKCNLAVVTDSAAITSDRGIYKALSKRAPQIDLLLISPGAVKLPGFAYGFIGGASGRVGDEMIFNGNLEAHPDFENIREFVLAHMLKLKYFTEYELTDIGSIIEEI